MIVWCRVEVELFDSDTDFGHVLIIPRLLFAVMEVFKIFLFLLFGGALFDRYVEVFVFAFTIRLKLKGRCQEAKYF